MAERLTHEEIFSSEDLGIYDGFSAIVEHARNYFSFLGKLGFVDGAGTCLSVGCGKGQLEIMLMRANPGLKMSVIEPSSYYLGEFLRASLPVKGQVERTHNETFQKFISHHGDGGKFDRLLSVHSWYGLGNSELGVRGVMELVKPGGKILISVVDKNNETLKWAELCGVPPYEWNSNVFSDWLKGLGIKHEYKTEERYVPLHSVYRDGAFTKAGRGFLAFHALLPFEKVGTEVRKQFRQAITAKSTYKDRNGAPAFKLSNGCIIISNQ